jgi:hypothetical protein
VSVLCSSASIAVYCSSDSLSAGMPLRECMASCGAYS